MSNLAGSLLLVVFATLPAAPTATAEATAVPLWQGGEGECQLRLESPTGDIEVAVASGRPRLVGDAAAWRLEASEVGGVTRLSASVVAPAAPLVRPLRLEAPGTCRLTVVTRQGNVQAVGAFLAPLELETDSGTLTLRVIAASDLAVELATSGEITVDFSVSIDYRHHREPAKHGRIVLGSASNSARLSSRVGTIRVLKLD